MVLKERSLSEDLSQRILEEAADCHDIQPEEIDAKLENRVDPDRPATLWNGTPRENYGVVSFAFNECRVTVTANGEVEAQLHR